VHEHARTGTEVFDGLRGVAILLVVIFHTWLFAWYTPYPSLFGIPVQIDVLQRTGYLGVDLFFMISGFVLFFPHAQQTLGTGHQQSIREFARRRFHKIVPSYLLVLAVTAVAAYPEVQSMPALLESLANHVLFFQNSFDDRMGGVNSVLWSLAVEVQFYLIFPLIAFAFVRRPFVIWVAMFVAAVAYRYWAARCCLQIEPVTRQLPAFLDVFACGMAAAYALVWLRARVPRLERFALPFTFAAIACLVAGWMLLVSANLVAYEPGGKERWLLTHRTLFAAVGAGFGLASCLAAVWWRRIVANPVLVFAGLISYNLYLWHTLVLIWMWRHGVPPAATADPHDDAHWQLVYIASGWTACVVISAAITYFFERPLLGTSKRPPFSFDWRRLRRWWILRWGRRTETSPPSRIRNPR
jgi:peptidoglycan/LPS O-acetylase OafA/YrhL